MQATVQVSQDVACALRKQRADPAVQPLFGVLEKYGVKLEPVHEHTVDPILQSYFFMELPDDGKSAEILTLLKEIPGVEAAYVKPPDALP